MDNGHRRRSIIYNSKTGYNNIVLQYTGHAQILLSIETVLLRRESRGLMRERKRRIEGG